MQTMKTLTRLFSLLAILVMVGCSGGGGSTGSCTFSCTPGGGAVATAADAVLILSSASIGNDGSQTVTATVTALDANRNALKDVAVTITADNDAIVTLAGSGVTDSTGVMKATVSIGANRNNRTIVVTATSGSLTKKVNLAVVDASQVIPTAADISLALSAPSVNNSGSATVIATVTAVDKNRNAIAGIPITLKVNNDATIIVSGQTSSNVGVVTGTIGIGSNKANRQILVTAISGTLTREAAVQVVGTSITATALPSVLTPGAKGLIQYRVIDSNKSPLTAFPIRIVGVGGVVTEAQSDLNGSYEYAYTAPATAGNLDIRASSGGVDNVTSVIVQAGAGVIPDVPAGSVRSASVRANPSVVATNGTTSTTNRTEIRALFVGDANQPIQNVRVRFDLDGDANSIGGSIVSGSTLIYSDANGVALSAYIPGQRFSPTDGLTVRACWGYNDAQAIACANSTKTTLTVVSDPLSVTIGTDNLVIVGDLIYTQRFVIQVNDSSGLAKADVLVSPLLDLTSFSQGYWTRPPGADSWSQIVTAARCGNEDVNRNGILEVYSNGMREDANNNGQLDPRKADVVVSVEGSNKTDSSGLVKLRITYPQNIGSWVRYALTVAATGVSGTEGRANFSGELVVPITAVKAEGVPAFVDSPYGRTDGNPRVVVTTPDGRSSASLCSK
jgi:Bacterial Ig-like domain (group 1)